ncbi:MAG: PRD domain-containing protein [Clostridiales bacterium]|nr:PRD domain-containing protein [Clostridiales bacterium]
MGILLEKPETIIKVFNNNVVLVSSEENNKEKILFAKGIGFAKKNGEKILKGTEIEKIFTIEENENIHNFKSIIERIDSDFFGICEEAIYEVSKKIKVELNENIHIGLVDHLFLAVKRIKNNEIINNPFLVEIQTLYRKEYDLAQLVGNKIEKELKVKMPEDEIGFVAMHIHSAITNTGLSSNIRNNYIINEITNYIEENLKIKIDRKSFDYARFITHIKFALQRIVEKKPAKNDLKEVIKLGYSESYSLSKSVSQIIGNELNIEVSEDEIAFLAIHIERFRMMLEK